MLFKVDNLEYKLENQKILIKKNFSVEKTKHLLILGPSGSGKTTLINLTTAYAPFVNGGIKVNANLISRIQDRRGKTIYLPKNKKCFGGDKFIDKSMNYPKITNANLRVISEETAYQMTSILSGAVKRGTAKKLKNLNVPLAGKTGTTNNNYDAWFIGFSSNLVIGVYIGFDNPKTLGKYETGSKVALPVFKDFVEKAMFKEDFKEFNLSYTCKL